MMRRAYCDESCGVVYSDDNERGDDNRNGEDDRLIVRAARILLEDA